MNKSEYRINLDIHEAVSQVSLGIKQGDSTRKIYITLTENGAPYRIAPGCVAVFTAKKPDGTYIFNDCTISGDIIAYTVTSQTSAAAGLLPCELKLYGSDNALLHSPRFSVVVHDIVYDDDTAESSDEFTALTALISDAAEYAAAEAERASAEAVRASAETSRDTAEDERTAAESARASAESARVTAEGARASAESARANAESVRGNAESERVSAESLRVSAEGGRASAETSRATAETSRVSAESLRVNTESARTSAESARASAEAARVSAEGARALCEPYNAAHAYVIGNKVTSDGATYRCISPCTGVAVTDTAKWLLIARAGYDLTAEQSLTDTQKSTAQANLGLDNKAETDGYYALMGVGVADNLAGKGDGVGASYIRRTTGGTADVADGAATIKSVKGNTIVWNQLVPHTSATRTHNGITFTNNGDGSWTVNGTATASAYVILATRDLGGTATNMVTPTSFLYYNRYIFTKVNPSAGIGLGYNQNNHYITINVTGGLTFDNVTIIPQIFDLTKMFGAGNEPSSVEAFRALFPNDYYEYDAGSLLSFNPRGIKTVGFNLFDAETKLMAIEGATKVGEYYSFPASNAYTVYGAGQALKIPDNYTGQIQITFNGYTTNADGAFRFRYDYVDGSRSNGAIITSTTPADYVSVSTEGKAVKSISMGYGSAAQTISMKDVCIHFVWSGIRNGEYEDYWTQTRSLPIATYFPNGMRSAGTAYDELTASKATTRIDRLVLTGTESGLTSLGDGRVYMHLDNAKRYPTSHFQPIKSSHYGTVLSSDPGYGNACVNNLGNLLIGIAEGQTLAQYKAWLAEQYAAGTPAKFFYEVETPTEVDITTPLNMTYTVSDFGTEELVSDSEDVPQTAPCNMEVVYGLNAVDTIRRMPVNYISEESLDAFCTVLGGAIGVTVTRVWDDVNGRYNFTVVSNG